MSIHDRTLDKNRKEIMKEDSGNTVKFRSEDFVGKKIVFLLAKTWGAARVFFFRTKLKDFRNIKIEYLHHDRQLRGLNGKEIIIIALDRALENEINPRILHMAKSRNIKIINYEIPVGV